MGPTTCLEGFSKWVARLNFEECLWTCEKNLAARSSHMDVISEDACRHMDVCDFTSESALAEMKKVAIKNNVHRFKKWVAIGRKAELPTTAFCARHLKKCPVISQYSLLMCLKMYGFIYVLVHMIYI